MEILTSMNHKRVLIHTNQLGLFELLDETRLVIIWGQCYKLSREKCKLILFESLEKTIIRNDCFAGAKNWMHSSQLPSFCELLPECSLFNDAIFS